MCRHEAPPHVTTRRLESRTVAWLDVWQWREGEGTRACGQGWWEEDHLEGGHRRGLAYFKIQDKGATFSAP